jgi:hypothetical protein
MNETPRRRPVWKILLGVAAFPAVVAGATFLWIDRVAERRWDSFVVQVEALRKEVQAKGGPRPVLRGAAEPGNAWDDYVSAFAAYRRPVGRLPALYPLDQIPPPEEVEVLRAHLKANEAVLERVRRGTHRAIGDFSPHWEEGMECKHRRPYRGEEVSCLFRFQARQLIREGRDTEAAELLLDYLQFVRDAVNWPALSWSVGRLTGEVEEDLRMLVVCRPLSAGDLLEIERELAALESGLPASDVLLKLDLLAFGSELRRPGLGYYSADNIPRRSLWRYGYSDRIAAVEGYARSERWIFARIREETEPWGPLRNGYAAMPWGVDNPYFDQSFRLTTYRFSGSIRKLCLPWRLLRVAAHFRATGVWLELEDPYGTTLRHRIDGARLRAWSVGVDGIDQGSLGFHGNWSRPFPIPGQAAVFFNDEAIEVSR